MYDLERNGEIGVYDSVKYIKFGVNSPESIFKSKSPKANLRF